MNPNLCIAEEHVAWTLSTAWGTWIASMTARRASALMLQSAITQWSHKLVSSAFRAWIAARDHSNHKAVVMHEAIGEPRRSRGRSYRKTSTR